MKKLIFLFLIFSLAGCKGPYPKSPFAITGFWPNDQSDQKKISSKGTGLFPIPSPLKGKILSDLAIAIEPGDKVQVLVQDQKEITGEYNVSGEGFIILPLVGAVSVAGLNEPEAAALLESELTKYIRQPRVTVQIIDSFYKKVIVYGAFGGFGDTKQMDVYKLTKQTRLLDLLTDFGGPAAGADIRNITIIHRDGSKELIDLNKIVINGEHDKNIVLRGGDIVSIPSSKTGENSVLVLGAVQIPGMYAAQPEITALKAIALAKSFTPEAYVEDSFVIRTGVENPYLLRVNFKRLLLKGETFRDVPLQKGDIVFVPDNPISNYNRILKRITPTVNILDNIANLVLSVDAVSQAFDRGFGEVEEDESTSEVSQADLNRAASQAVDRASQ